MTGETIDIKELDKADVLAALYNASKPQGMGFMHYDPTPMTREQAQEIIGAGQTDFDYLMGRVMKIDISGDELNPWGYDRDNGQGSVERVISALRSTGQTNPAEISSTHRSSTLRSAADIKGKLSTPTTSETRGDLYVVNLGLDDVADELNDKVDGAIRKLNEDKD